MAENFSSPPPSPGASPAPLVPNQEDALAWSRLLFGVHSEGTTRDDTVVELRAFDVPLSEYGSRAATGFFDNPESLAQAAVEASSIGATAVYATLNPATVRAEVERNVMDPGGNGSSTGAKFIQHPLLLLICIDPVRIGKESSTDLEKEMALAKMLDVLAYLSDLGWPSPVQADSGNGYHLLYRIDLANDDASTALVKGELHSLAAKFSHMAVTVDVAVSDTYRSCEFYGTISRKYPHSDDRPHRVSKLISVPEPWLVVPVEKLKALGGETTGEIPTPKSNRVVQAGPQIPDVVYEMLPKTLKDLVRYFEEGHMRDIVLSCMLPVVASFVRNTFAPHRDGMYGMLFYVVVLGPAGGGKGVAKWALRLGSATQKRFADAYQGAVKSDGLTRALTNTLGDVPQQQMFIIPANISGSALIRMLQVNGGHGVLSATEIDSVTVAMKQDWGGQSDVFRANWHHEMVSISRVGEVVSVDHPSMSIMLTGTPDQFFGLVPTPENGLFSRIMPYVFGPPVKWVDHRPGTDSGEREKVFDETSVWFDTKVLQALDSRSEPLVVTLKAEHWDRHEKAFSDRVDELEEALGVRAGERMDTLGRSGVVALRLACTFAVIRAAESGMDLAIVGALECDDASFEAGLRLTFTYLAHSDALRSIFQKRQGTIVIQDSGGDMDSGRRQALLSGLPEKFTTAEAKAKGKELGISGPTVERELKAQRQKGNLIRAGHGLYQKRPEPS